MTPPVLGIFGTAAIAAIGWEGGDTILSCEAGFWRAKLLAFTNGE